MSGTKLVGMIVAAGYSSRMGAFKPLLKLGDKTVIERAVQSLRKGGIFDIRVVVGFQAKELYPVLEPLQVVVIENPHYAQGMFSSVVAGLKTFDSEIDGFFLLPGDTPLIRRHSIRDMVRKYRKTRAAVVYPVFNGQRGHPPLIDAACFASILSGDGQGGLRNILKVFEADSLDVPVADQGVLLDMDTQKDYSRLKDFYDKRHLPTYEEGFAILNMHQQVDRVLRHCQVVAEVGRRLALKLNSKGWSFNEELVYIGGLLHDLAKGKPNHSRRGKQLLRGQGFSLLSEIVASHMDLTVTKEYVLDEAGLVFLADKLVQCDQVVSLEERFRTALDKFYGNAELQDIVLRRRHTAEILSQQVTSILGMSIEEIVVNGGEKDGANLFK